MPIFIYLLVQGFFHTKNFKKYVLRIFSWGIVTQISFCFLALLNVKYIPEYTAAKYNYTNLNILFTFASSLILMKVVDEKELIKKLSYNKNIFIKVLCILLIVVATFIMPIDYNVVGVVLATLFYVIEKFRTIVIITTENKQRLAMKITKVNSEKVLHIIYVLLLFFVILLVTLYFDLIIYTLFAIIPIALYNGKKGNKSKILKNSFCYLYLIHNILLYLAGMYIMLT